MINNINIHARNRNWYDGIEILISNKDSRTNCVAQPLTFKEEEQGTMSEPTLTIKTEEAQQLMDELWHCGIRPTEGTGSAGSLKATERHLEDMRTLVFQEIK